MCRNALTVLLIFFSAVSVYTKTNIYWADTVFTASSQFNPNIAEYSARQALGAPSVMPDFGISSCAWSPYSSRTKYEWIELGFNKNILPKQIAVYENCNPGAIYKITAYSLDGKEAVVFSNPRPEPNFVIGKILYIFNPKIDFNVSRLRIDINLSLYSDAYQIDAVAVSDGLDSIKFNINQPKDLIFESEAENLGKNINSKYSELAPIISSDGNTLYFTRSGHPENLGFINNQDIWYSSKDEQGNFLIAENIGAPINNEANNFAFAVTSDGNGLYIGNEYFPDGRMRNGFSVIYKTLEYWTFPKRIEVVDYKNFSKYCGYYISGNGKILLMSVQREKGYGKNDIFVSFLSDNNIWSKPMNLGSTINTADSEDSPFLAADGKTLYFSTGGRPGYGKNDLFMSVRLDSTWTNWSEPVNLGNTINSENWDAYYTVPASGEYAYFVSNKNSFGDEDIFRIKLPSELKPQAVVLISGKVINAKTNKPLEAEIKYETLPDGKNAGIARSNPKTGEYKIALPAGFKYGYLAQANGYVSVNENIDLKTTDKYQEIKKDLLLIPIEAGATIRINNIFFEFGKYELLVDSYSELNRIVDFMKSNPKVEILINGHTDNIGDKNSNKILSQNRADAVKKYLIDKGIVAERLKSKGWGDSKPIADNQNEDNRQKNRRVEIVLSK